MFSFHEICMSCTVHARYPCHSVGKELPTLVHVQKTLGRLLHQVKAIPTQHQHDAQYHPRQRKERVCT